MNIPKFSVWSISLELANKDDRFKTFFQKYVYVQEYFVSKDQYLEDQEATTSFPNLWRAPRHQGC
jgi:hypothetical protein